MKSKGLKDPFVEVIIGKRFNKPDSSVGSLLNLFSQVGIAHASDLSVHRTNARCLPIGRLENLRCRHGVVVVFLAVSDLSGHINLLPCASGNLAEKVVLPEPCNNEFFSARKHRAVCDNHRDMGGSLHIRTLIAQFLAEGLHFVYAHKTSLLRTIYEMRCKLPVVLIAFGI